MAVKEAMRVQTPLLGCVVTIRQRQGVFETTKVDVLNTA